MCFVGEVPKDETGEGEKQHGAWRMHSPTFFAALPLYMGPSSWGARAQLASLSPPPAR